MISNSISTIQTQISSRHDVAQLELESIGGLFRHTLEMKFLAILNFSRKHLCSFSWWRLAHRNGKAAEGICVVIRFDTLRCTDNSGDIKGRCICQDRHVRVDVRAIWCCGCQQFYQIEWFQATRNGCYLFHWRPLILLMNIYLPVVIASVYICWWFVLIFFTFFISGFKFIFLQNFIVFLRTVFFLICLSVFYLLQKKFLLICIFIS